MGGDDQSDQALPVGDFTIEDVTVHGASEAGPGARAPTAAIERIQQNHVELKRVEASNAATHPAVPSQVPTANMTSSVPVDSGNAAAPHRQPNVHDNTPLRPSEAANSAADSNSCPAQ